MNASMPPGCDRRERSRPRSVSVVIPAYNAAATLAEQLEALAGQECEDDWEVVIADNGSTGGTADIARRYAPRFKALTVVDSGPRRGHSAPRNAGAKTARGELLVFRDRPPHDPRIKPESRIPRDHRFPHFRSAPGERPPTSRYSCPVSGRPDGKRRAGQRSIEHARSSKGACEPTRKSFTNSG
jgi:hypothetical protein